MGEIPEFHDLLRFGDTFLVADEFYSSVHNPTFSVFNAEHISVLKRGIFVHEPDQASIIARYMPSIFFCHSAHSDYERTSELEPEKFVWILFVHKYESIGSFYDSSEFFECLEIISVEEVFEELCDYFGVGFPIE